MAANDQVVEDELIDAPVISDENDEDEESILFRDDEPIDDVGDTDDSDNIKDSQGDETASNSKSQSQPNIDDNGDFDIEFEKPLKLKAGGSIREFRSLNELKPFVQKGFDYSQKTMELGKHRAMIQALVNNGITNDDINLFLDLKAGKKEAIAKIVQDYKVDPFDVSAAKNYTPTNKIPSDTFLELQDVDRELRSSGTKYNELNQVLATSFTDSADLFVENPKLLKGLHTDLETGVFNNIMPEAEKIKYLNPETPLLHAYMMVANKYNQARQAAVANNAVPRNLPQSGSKVSAKRAVSAPKSQPNSNRVVAERVLTDLSGDEKENAFAQWAKRNNIPTDD